jgi:alanyl-tRNA synthetase
VEVVDVLTRPEDHAVVHVLAGGHIDNDVVACQIDWPRRLDHMQHHTGQHILTRAFVEVAHANTVSFHLSPDSVTIDLEVEYIAPDMLARVEDFANQIVYEDHSVTARVVSAEEFARIDARMRRRPDHLDTDGLRVIEIEGLDATACGGTHVARTGEIGIIKVLKLERSAPETRVEFRCGSRALGDYRQKNTLANQLAAEFSVGIWEIDQAVARLKAELQETHSALRDAQGRLLDREADDLLAAAPVQDGVRVVKATFDTRDVADLRALAGRLVATPSMVVMLGTAGEKAQLVVARSADLPYDMRLVLKQALTVLGSDRGGGRPEFAQGGGVEATVEKIEAALQDTVFG